MRPLLRQHIDGPLLRFAVDAHIGDGVEPDLYGCLDGGEVGHFEPVGNSFWPPRRNLWVSSGSCGWCEHSFNTVRVRTRTGAGSGGVPVRSR